MYACQLKDMIHNKLRCFYDTTKRKNKKKKKQKVRAETRDQRGRIGFFRSAMDLSESQETNAICIVRVSY